MTSQTRLTALQRKNIVYQYQSKQFNIRQLSGMYGVSQRTIGRVIVAAGLSLPVERLQGEAKLVMEILHKHKVTSLILNKLLTNHAKQYLPTNLLPISNKAQMPLGLKEEEQPNDKHNSG